MNGEGEGAEVRTQATPERLVTLASAAGQGTSIGSYRLLPLDARLLSHGLILQS